ncbi:heterokaryon incompatibility protein het-6-like protein [Penicillium viridicatum]|nr:heterokaryon incompatibility protein het-6-like protein [Penicillium viridicatum]
MSDQPPDPRDSKIPANDPLKPRWLLDTKKWRIVLYTDVASQVGPPNGEYGIVSYTWGYISNLEAPATGTPAGILWDVPTTTGWTLATAKKVMEKIGSRYIWWDWMCVPQEVSNGTKPITALMRQVQAEEIAKQVDARTSIVWLHSTSWALDSPIKSLVLPIPAQGNDVLVTIDKIASHLNNAQANERWLLSGWTLQEGVMLSETRLIDGAGEPLENERFIHGGLARVINLTDTVSKLASEIGKAFVNQADGKKPQNSIDEAIGASAENYERLLDIITQFVKSGLVAYARGSPLYILVGKKNRLFGRPLDKYWALLGAMGIDDLQVSYTLPTWQVKTVFLRALVRKFQWSLLLLPDPSFDYINFNWLQLVDGDLFPIGVFVDSTLGHIKNPPILSYSSDAIHIRPNPEDKKKTSISVLQEPQIKAFRYYRQIKDRVRIITSTTATPEDRDFLSQTAYLPIEDLESREDQETKEELTGKRCVVVLGFYKPPQRGEVGVYRGTIDIWYKIAKVVEVGSLQLDATS